MTRRAQILSLLLLAFCLWWVARAEIAGRVYLICWTLMMPAVACLTGLLAVNGWVARRAPALALSRAELLFIYLVLSCGLPVAGFGMVRFLLPILGAAVVPAVGSGALGVGQHLPAWFLPEAPAASFAGFFHGGRAVPWSAWRGPLLVWSGVILLLCTAGVCLSLLLRERWIEEERLTFPAVYLPLRMTEGGLFRHWLFWLGFAIPALFQSLLAVNALYPSVPAVQLRAEYYPLFPQRPWSAFGAFPVGVYPLAVGLAYLIPTDISFSLWFFYLLPKLVSVAGEAWGLETADGGARGARFPYLEEQAAGAWLCLGLLGVLGARRQLRRLARMPAAWGLAASVIGLVLFWTAAGMQAWVAGVVILLYGLLLVAGARIRAQIGAQWILIPLVWNPGSLAVNAWGAGAFTGPSLALLTVLHAFVIDVRAHPMPNFLEACKIGDGGGLKRAPLVRALLLALLAAIPLALVTSLLAYYDAGAAGRGSPFPLAKTRVAYSTWEGWVREARLPDTAGTLALCTGAGITALLSLLHARFSGFPFHGIGYAAANTYTGRAFTISFFLAWGAKTLLLRYGGARLYRTGLLFFLGVALGDILTQCAWTVAGMVLGFEVYGFVT
jgi:hypothetical protein